MSIPQTKTWEIYQGQDEYCEIVLSNKVDGVDVPFNLEGSEMVLTVDGMPAMRKSSNTPGSGLTIVNAAGGRVGLKVTRAEGRTFSIGATLSDLERRIDDNERVLARIQFEVSKGVNDDAGA